MAGTCTSSTELTPELWGSGGVKLQSSAYTWNPSGSAYTPVDQYSANIGQNEYELTTGTNPRTRYGLSQYQFSISNFPAVGGSQTCMKCFGIYDDSYGSDLLNAALAGLESWTITDTCSTVTTAEYTTEAFDIYFSLDYVVVTTTVLSLFVISLF